TAMPWFTRRWKLACVLGLAVAVVLVRWGWDPWRDPYGHSHCCGKGLWMALANYADEHHGAYPAGEATPQASLSLLCPKYADADLLRGKTVPLEVVQATLDRGERLGPDTCGWHFVEGLRRDDVGVALFWDKAGLGHFGERLPAGDHEVFLVG